MLTTQPFFFGKEKILYPKKKPECCIQKRNHKDLYPQNNSPSGLLRQRLLSRKGSGWLLFFFVVFLTFMGGILMYEVGQLQQTGSTGFGEKQIALFQLYGDSEEKHLGLREHVKLARDESILELAGNGGFSKDNSCEKRGGEAVWEYDKCWPDVERNFQLLLERKLEERGLRVEGVSLEKGILRIAFGDFEFSREFGDGGIAYTRNLTIEEDAGLDFMQIQALKRKLIEARNKGDYSGLGKIEAGYMRLSIENDKNALRLLQGKGFIVEKPMFVFWVKV